MRVGVIIVTYNATPWHEKCLAPLSKNQNDGNVYIIDNGSSDGTQDLIQTNYPDFIFYQSKTNLGFGKANNLGLKIALEDGCTHFLLLNQDASIKWEDIVILANIQDQYCEYGVISPIHFNSESLVDMLHLKTILKNGFDFINDLIVGNCSKTVYDIYYTNAAIWMISKQCLEKVGGFDPLFPHYGEDVEYAQRANNFGFKVGLYPKVKAFHFRNQEINRKKTKSSFYISFLIELKNTQRKLLSIYIRLFVGILFHTLKKVINREFNLIFNEWAAFFTVIKNYNKIKRNRISNIHNSYSFINTTLTD